MRTFRADRLTVRVFDSRAEMGSYAADDIAAEINALLERKPTVNVIFAAAPSQNDVLFSLVGRKDIEWGRINAFHMDEYVGLPADAPQGFGNFLRAHIFDLVPFRTVNLMDGGNDPEAECARYSALIDSNPPDLIVMGIGENGHIAFNDPGVADFHDARTVKVVPLDPICRQQQVNDGCFARLCDVPTHALTLTVPTFIQAPRLFCIVPAATKANAVKETITSEIGEHCPATVLRRHENSTLYLDSESARMI